MFTTLFHCETDICVGSGIVAILQPKKTRSLTFWDKCNTIIMQLL